MELRRAGNSGLVLPKVSIGCWQNFGFETNFEEVKTNLIYAFDQGIFHVDLANNYGKPHGSAETQVGKVLHTELLAHRDELIISTKAGYYMWNGPYGDGGSRKYLVASLDQSLKRLQLEYVDIFYHHRPDPNITLEETAEALAHLVRQGKALYIGLSNYSMDKTLEMHNLLKQKNVPVVVHQGKYSLLSQEYDVRFFEMLKQEKIGFTAFSALAQGLLTGKYQSEIPAVSRVNEPESTINERLLNDQNKEKIEKLTKVAASWNLSLTELSLRWVMSNPMVTSLLMGVRNSEQLKQNISISNKPDFSKDEMEAIEKTLQMPVV